MRRQLDVRVVDRLHRHLTVGIANRRLVVASLHLTALHQPVTLPHLDLDLAATTRSPATRGSLPSSSSLLTRVPIVDPPTDSSPMDIRPLEDQEDTRRRHAVTKWGVTSQCR